MCVNKEEKEKKKKGGLIEGSLMITRTQTQANPCVCVFACVCAQSECNCVCVCLCALTHFAMQQWEQLVQQSKNVCFLTATVFCVHSGLNTHSPQCLVYVHV